VAILTITEAAKLFGKSRTTLYKYNKSGSLSFVSGSDGKPAVDMTEMLRVFGSVHDTSVHNTQNEHCNTPVLNTEHDLLEEKLPRYRRSSDVRTNYCARRTIGKSGYRNGLSDLSSKYKH
jgi:hypothetical protein